MRTTPARITFAIVVFAAALGGALLLLRGSESPATGGGAAGKAGGGKQPAAATTDVWKVGDTWTVTVRQDAGAITPDGGTSVAEIPYRFKVTKAPTDPAGTWLVEVRQDGAEGPFAAGWRLHYAADGDGLVLTRVAVGQEPPLEAELATIVLGPQFPYEVRYGAPPKDTTIDADRLLDRSELPPTAQPGGGTAGAAPPAEAPGDGLPTAPPVQ